VLQFYPETEGQSATVMAEAKKAGFGGGIVVDYPESKKARKYYLCLVAGSTNASTFSTPLGLQEEADQNLKRRKDRKDKKTETRKEFIIRKKELYRKRGKEGVPYDSKYSGRKRRTQF
jgi:18S rRNA (guanine1575-N7)-methyltransferase